MALPGPDLTIEGDRPELDVLLDTHQELVSLVRKFTSGVSGLGQSQAYGVMSQIISLIEGKLTGQPGASNVFGDQILSGLGKYEKQILDTHTRQFTDIERRAAIGRMGVEVERKLLAEMRKIERQEEDTLRAKREQALEAQQQKDRQEAHRDQMIASGMLVATGGAVGIMHQAIGAQPHLSSQLSGSWQLLMAQLGRELTPHVINLSGLLQQLRLRFRDANQEVREGISTGLIHTALIGGTTLGASRLAGIFSAGASRGIMRGGAFALGGMLAGDAAHAMGAPLAVESGLQYGGLGAGLGFMTGSRAWAGRLGFAGLATGALFGAANQQIQSGAAVAAGVEPGDIGDEISQVLQRFQGDSILSRSRERLGALQQLASRHGLSLEEIGLPARSGPGGIYNRLDALTGESGFFGGGAMSPQRIAEIVAAARAGQASRADERGTMEFFAGQTLVNNQAELERLRQEAGAAPEGSAARRILLQDVSRLETIIAQQESGEIAPGGEGTLTQRQREAAQLLFMDFQSQSFGIENIRDVMQAEVIRSPGQQELFQLQVETLQEILTIIRDANDDQSIMQRIGRLLSGGR